MAIDVNRRRIYVYGGKICGPEGISLNPELYEYNLETAEWSKPWHGNKNLKFASLPGRRGHGMAAVSSSQDAFVVSVGGTGTGATDLSSEMISYDPREDTFRMRYDAPTSDPVSLCADPDSGDLFSLHDTHDTQVDNTSGLPLPPKLSIFDNDTSAWIDTTAFHETGGNPVPCSTSLNWSQPCVYDPFRNHIYTFDDETGHLWTGRVKRTSLGWSIRKLTFFIRAQQFREMCEGSTPSVETLLFLKSSVSPLVDRDDPEQHDLLQALVTHLLSSCFTPSLPNRYDATENDQVNGRLGLSAKNERHEEDSQLSSGLPAPLVQSDAVSKTFREAPQQNLQRVSQRRALFERIVTHLKAAVREPAEDLTELVAGASRG